MKVVAKKSIKIGEVFSESNLTVMRAKKGEINGRELKSLLNKKSKLAYKKFEPIKRSELLKVGIFITARLKSERLPRKVIKPILGKPIIEWMIDRLKRCNVDLIVMMTSINPQDDLLIEIAKKNDIYYFRGSEDDVLLRMRDCARKFDIELVISATADDPFKEPIFIEKMIERYLNTKFDFCEIEGLPNGCESHAVSRIALEKVCDLKDSSDTEIWGPYFREAGVFNCDIIKVADPNILRPQYRVTLDTKEDFELVTQIFSILSKEKEYFNVYDICKLLDENKALVAINSHIQQRSASRIQLKLFNKDRKMEIKSDDYHDYVIKDGKFIGAFEEMYQNIDDPWHHGDATAIQYDLALYLINRYRICDRGFVLDIGCGKGAFTARLRQQLPKAHILAVDVAPTAIKKAKQKYGNLGIEFQVMDIQKEYKNINDKFDLIVMSQLMWYILPDFGTIVNQLGEQTLKDDGYLLINQAFYKPEEQKYGKEIVSTIEDMFSLIKLEVIEMVETNRLSSHDAIVLLKKCRV